MLLKLLPEPHDDAHREAHEHIFDSLKNIEQRLLAELAAKQKTLEASMTENRSLRALLERKDQSILALQQTVTDNQRNIDGNRQLINKLLNDLERMRQDIEWYKRTYESRSLLGTIKQKVFGRG